MKIDPLTDKSDFDFWSEMVKKVLQQYKLEDLLDRNITRPLPGTLYYNRWRAVSQAVSTWLLNSVAKDVFRSVFKSQKPFRFADKAYNSIQTTVMGSGYNMAHNTIMRAITMQRSHYGSIEQYVIAFQDSILDANRVSNPPMFSPFLASLMILRALELELHA
jgi:hypothetical protein